VTAILCWAAKNSLRGTETMLFDVVEFGLYPSPPSANASILALFLSSSVGDPDPEPDPDLQDPHVLEPPGSGSISQRCGSLSGSRFFPFLSSMLSGLK
jgi:hypothetical protein